MEFLSGILPWLLGGAALLGGGALLYSSGKLAEWFPSLFGERPPANNPEINDPNRQQNLERANERRTAMAELRNASLMAGAVNAWATSVAGRYAIQNAPTEEGPRAEHLGRAFGQWVMGNDHGDLDPAQWDKTLLLLTDRSRSRVIANLVMNAAGPIPVRRSSIEPTSLQDAAASSDKADHHPTNPIATAAEQFRHGYIPPTRDDANRVVTPSTPIATNGNSTNPSVA